MAFFPLFLDLSGKNVLVAGAGAVGRRKITALLPCNPQRLIVVDPALAQADLAAPQWDLLNHSAVVCYARAVTAHDLDGVFLAFAASSDKAVNEELARLCAEKGILCNCVAPPKAGDCLVPAHFHQDGLTIAISTQGHSPALARVLREELEAYTASRYTLLLQLMGRLRPLLLAQQLPTQDNTDIFRALVRSPLAAQLKENKHDEAAKLLYDILPQALHPQVRDILHEL